MREKPTQSTELALVPKAAELAPVPPVLSAEFDEALEPRNELLASYYELIANFESLYPLSELHAIVDLRPADAPRHPLREPARQALIPIDRMMKAFEADAHVGADEVARALENYRRLSRAIGVINGLTGKVDHTR